MFSGVDKTVEALLRGQGCANHLKMQLENHETRSLQTEVLVETVLDSFSIALSFFMSITSRHRASSSQNMASKSLKRKSCGEEGLENYRDDSPSPFRDNFSWRKYGQKKIKTSSYQRCYYRCAYADDQNCHATKRVQMIKDNPSVYRTTYVGQHMCEVAAFPQPNDDNTYGSKMIQFEKFKEAVMPESLMHQLVLVDHQETIVDEDTNHIMNQECDDNELLLEDDQFWENEFPPFSPGHIMFLGDIDAFDSKPCQLIEWELDLV